mmetsp:Transcript_24028/g.72211  ORF Transcript_24028/g.72211 Transcript_24028/m.72211 type:complete len:134 (+) Transcript_24028:552-953(+)
MLLRCPEAVVDHILAYNAIKEVRRFSFTSRSVSEQALERLQRLPDPTWTIGRGDARTTESTYYARDARIGDTWREEYERSIVKPPRRRICRRHGTCGAPDSEGLHYTPRHRTASYGARRPALERASEAQYSCK